MINTLLAKYGTGRNGHAHFAPSSASGWLNCPGYLLANAVVGDTAGYDAAYGTVAHEIAQRWRTKGYRPDDMLGRTITQDGHDVAVDRSMLDALQRFIEWCDEVPGDVYIEQKVDLSGFLPIPKQRGTADHIVCSNGVLTITDLKMGIGVRVFVERNEQAMLYALGAYEEYNWLYGFQRIVIRICQPRLDYFGTWDCTREELLAFGEHVRERSALAWREDAPRIPGPKQCRFCRVSKTCPALSMHLDQLADDSFDAVEDAVYGTDEMAAHEATVRTEGAVKPGSPLALSTEFLAYRLKFYGLYTKWFRSIQNELLDRALKGEKIPGWQLKPGKRSWKWSDNAHAAVSLMERLDETEVYQTEVISITEARKKLRATGMKPKEIAEFLADVMVGTPGVQRLGPAEKGTKDSNDAVDDAFEIEEGDDDL